MALTNLAVVRRLAAEPTTTTYSDVEITERLLAVDNSINTVVRDIWIEKMSAAAVLVNVSEGGSSRSLSQAYDHAKEMVAFYTDLAFKETGGRPVLRKITRV